MTFYSCDNYLDVNDSPNNPTASLVNPKLSLSASISRPYRNITITANELGNVWMNSWGGNVNQITSAYSTEYSLQLNNDFNSTIWNNLYLNTANLQNIINYDSVEYDNHKAIAKIMKTYYFQYIVDLYGDIPYSEAHDAANLNPKYDDDVAVYRALYTQLDEAIALINAAPVVTIAVGDEDPIFFGDMEMWKKFANTLKLKLLVRESTLAQSNSDSAAYLTQKFASLASASFITSDVIINPGYNGGSNNQQNPFYSVYGLDTAGNPGTRRQVVVATKHAVEFLNGIEPNTTFDNRISKLFTPITGGAYVGVTQGLQGAGNVPLSLSSLGTGLVVSSAQDGFIMTASESYFLQSEAVFRNYLSGDAKALFQSGIQSSFDLLGVPASAAAYIATSNTINGIGWDGSANKIQAIMTQKWVALMGINGIESYIEYVRTGFPATGVSTVAITPTGKLPKRLLYPTSELVGNSANVPSLSLSQAFNQGAYWSAP